jgi:hypothetical protein
VGKYGTARQATDDNIIRRMRFACCITKATDTHSECVIHIAFLRQQWLRERASMLRYTYIVSLVLSEFLSYLNLFIYSNPLAPIFLFVDAHNTSFT